MKRHRWVDPNQLELPTLVAKSDAKSPVGSSERKCKGSKVKPTRSKDDWSKVGAIWNMIRCFVDVASDIWSTLQ